MSHHPPAAAHHADSKHGWTLRQEIKITSKFRGKYLSIMPLGELWGLRCSWGLRPVQKVTIRRPSPLSGTIHCVFHASGNHYTWKKVTTTVHNIIVGKLWIDQVGRWAVPRASVSLQCREEVQGGAERISAVSCSRVKLKLSTTRRVISATSSLSPTATSPGMWLGR